MSLALWQGTCLALLVAAAMEIVAWGVHRYVMHGPGWILHRSHHVRSNAWLEWNDLYGLFFALISVALLMFEPFDSPGYWVGVGMTLYGALYAILHDGLVHRRLPLRFDRMNGYFRHLVRSHHLHHATQGRDGAVSFGFLYAPPLKTLAEQLRKNRQRRRG